MLASVAVAAVLMGGVLGVVTMNEDQHTQAQAQQQDRTPVVEVQKVETVNPFTE